MGFRVRTWRPGSSGVPSCWRAWCRPFAGAPFYRGAWNQLKAGNSNMDTLVALGSTTAFVYSVWALFAGLGGHLYFMESAGIITLISVGHWLESRVDRARLPRAARPAEPRAANRAATGCRLARNRSAGGGVAGRRHCRPASRRPGSHRRRRCWKGIPPWTNRCSPANPRPVDKTAGSRLYAGTVNLNGRLVMRVDRHRGRNRAGAHHFRRAARADQPRGHPAPGRPRQQRVCAGGGGRCGSRRACGGASRRIRARHVHDWLAPFLWPAHTPLTALAAAVVTGAAVLIVACPCAMGLATPRRSWPASNAGAQRGILIRDGVALEKAGASRR